MQVRMFVFVVIFAAVSGCRLFRQPVMTCGGFVCEPKNQTTYNEVIGREESGEALLIGQINHLDSGEGIGFCKVLLSDTNKVLLKGCVSDSLGFYKLSCPPGVYELTVRYVGYGSHSISPLTVQAGEHRQINVAMSCEPTGVAEEW